ncbi:hemolysin III [Loktanella ponticola]|uniref:Hemolysin III n=1 Tax=Yoonia ponticola TaxID=1524255 RepID=A0A7W9BI36_9RHOB|nr:hemolysin III family protein [Yoonia ponticola]MBB5720934.1 hemolysin III [Yoonia ponticola]
MYPTDAKSERIADGSMHAVGVIGSLTGAILLILLTFETASAGQMAALAVYGVALTSTFVASAFYHMTPWPDIRPTLRRIDHAAIYLMIAGTYTPLVVMVDTPLAYAILGIVWILGLIGMTLKLFFWQTPGRYGPALYLIMGWLSIGLIWSIWPVFPRSVIALIAVGGLTYTIGVVFYASEKKFTTAVWHGFVVAASACFWAAILIATLTVT